MERQSINLVTRLLYTAALCILLSSTAPFPVGALTRELLRGFVATPDSSVSPFQALLGDSSGNFSLGFLRVNRTQLALAVVHVASSEPLWVADTSGQVSWSESTRVFFNGSLVISDEHARVLWSTRTDGDQVWLSNTSNLRIEKLDESRSTLWQSFHFPSDTLVENQKFTSTMTLVSSNGLYSMRLGSDFIGLYAKFNQDKDSGQIYWKRKALEAKADIIEGQGPIYALLSPDGFLGMYQNGSVPVDVQSFSSFQQTGSGIRRVRIEPDGNFKGYFWTGSSWVLDYQAISDPCDLPSSCGPYSLCQPGKGCSCLDNQTDYNSGRCASSESNSGDFCGEQKHRALRRKGVELPYKELMGYERMGSLDQCVSACELNCSCWGVVYSNSSGFCYMVEYPIQTLVGIRDETKVGYFKVREGAGKKGMEVGYRIGIGLLCGVVSGLGVAVGFGLFLVRRKRRRKRRYLLEEEEGGGGVGVGPYKDLGSASFRSIELSVR